MVEILSISSFRGFGLLVVGFGVSGFCSFGSFCLFCCVDVLWFGLCWLFCYFWTGVLFADGIIPGFDWFGFG